MGPECVVADTNVVSYVLKGGPLGVEYAGHLRGKIVAVSFMTVAEMLYGADIAGWGASRRDDLAEVLRAFVILPCDYETCELWGHVTAMRQRAGLVISCADAWIAACALRHQLPLVTHNVRDFRDIQDLEVISSAIRN